MEATEINDIDVVLTSPPYNTSRVALDPYISRYDVYVDVLTDEEYINWTLDIFKNFDKILKPNGVVLYNLSYSSSNVAAMYELIANIISRSEFTIADQITWKKRTCLPTNTSPNKLSRICEYVFVFCRKKRF
jgi:DNA modification methylase